MVIQSSITREREGAFPAWRVLGIIFFSVMVFGCATSREDAFVASIIAEAMTNDFAYEESSPDIIPDERQSDSSVSTPTVVSVSPGGVLSANQVPAVSVTVPTSLAMTVPAGAPDEVRPLTRASSPGASVTVNPRVDPAPATAVAPLVTVAVPRSEAPPKGDPLSQEASVASGWSKGFLKPAVPTVQPDSVLWVSVVEDPSLNGRYVVNNSSAIDFGYVGLVFLPDMTVEQAEKEIKTVLEGRYLTVATVTVRVTKASYDVVGVMGAVQVPGEIKIGPGVAVTVTEVLRRAGGLKNERDFLQVKIIRGGLRTPFGPAAEGEIYSLSSEDGRLRVPDVFLRNNDLAYVFTQRLGATARGGKRIILLGEVPKRGVIDFAESEPCTLMYLLFKIGGLPRFAKADRIKVVRRSKDGKETTFTVDGGLLMDKGDPDDDLVLESGDRVIVPARKIAFF